MAVIKEYYTIKLHDTDAAGILFYANQFKIVHDVYEKLLSKIGCTFRERFTSRDFFIPIVHAEADFLQPVQVGDTVEISLTVDAIGNSSFTLDYEITDLDGWVVGTAQTVHVTADTRTRKKIPLPPAFREKLEEIEGAPDGEDDDIDDVEEEDE